ncbi:MAG: alpha/beta hydrolase fold domain-containing protein [Saprospiraceae bacterium]
MIKTIQVLTLLCLTLSLNAQEEGKLVVKTYKQIDTVALKMDIHYPVQYQKGERLPAIIFFFGGGWNGGSIEQFRPHAHYFASRGIIAVLADYRVATRHGTTPFDAVEDAKSAIRYLRKQADVLGIDPDKIIASGGSAGGHLAAATGNLRGLDSPMDDLSISAKANALVLFNPVYDNGPGQYGYDRVGDRYTEISPKHNIREGAPPAIVFFGTKDALVTPATAKSYEAAMKAVGSRCETFLYDEQTHGFFNFRKQQFYRETVYQADRFLASLGYLEGEPSIDPKIKVVVWDERQKKQQKAYPDFMGNHIADYLKKNDLLRVYSVGLDDPEQGLSDEVLENCEVMIWWGHVRHPEISVATSKKLIERVKAGTLEMIFLHSAHWANPFVEAMNEVTRQRVEAKYATLEAQVTIEFVTPPDSLRFRVPKLGEMVKPAIYERKFPDGQLKVKVDMPTCIFPFYRADGKPSTVITLQPKHPIAKGIPSQFTIPATEMYDEPFHVPDPDEVIFEERWETGEWFRSGSLWNVGKGKVFYFRPGHETYKVYYEVMPLKIIENTVLWMKGF